MPSVSAPSAQRAAMRRLRRIDNPIFAHQARILLAHASGTTIALHPGKICA
jgi:hypothetical protein